jgi:hypothetical protein
MVLGLARGGICGVAVGIFGRVISSFAPAHCLFMDCVSHLLSAFGNCNFSFCAVIYITKNAFLPSVTIVGGGGIWSS